jgi:hypothetical protein
MGWELISDYIKGKAERKKRELGDITVNQLIELIDTQFERAKTMEAFEDEFYGLDENTTTEWLDKIKLRLKSVVTTTVEPDNALDEDKNYERWIDKRAEKINWKYFDRYKTYLAKIGRPSEVIQNTETSTKGIIERLGDPKKKIAELQKGLVLGSVQSGKTANFNGVINRAIDAGYDLIIVCSGLMEDLRFQTQKRINNDVIGIGEINTQINQTVGVGEVESFRVAGANQIFSITTTMTDFKKSLIDANFDFNNTKILVCKKNVGVLTNLIYWLKSSMPSGQSKLPKSLLIVDDEADNASLNNLGHKGKEYASAVNKNIRIILNLFERRSYLGYTATPFANILQDQNDAPDTTMVVKFRYNGQVQELDCSLSPGLFPDKFIYKLSTPSSYLGPKRFFSNGREREGDRKIPLIETIPDPSVDEMITFDDEGTSLQKSLLDAIDCYILSIALRDSRKKVLDKLPGYVNHHTMLVHISLYINDQNIAAGKIKKYVSWITKKIQDDRITDPDGIYEKLRVQWNRFFEFKVEHIREYLPKDYDADGLDAKSWNDISKLLPNAVNGITVKAINSQTGDKLEYPDGGNKKYIAVGGNRLSRGFTLEGLTINYFLRDTNYYDTLLQMGRWFGYRPGYIDACRLFIDFDTEGKYNFITTALTELEEQIESMEYQKLKPKQFELRIRKNPGVLKITRPSILRNAKEIIFSFQNSAVQSTIFKFEKDSHNLAWERFQALFNTSGFVETPEFYTLDTDKNKLFEFLDLPGTWVNEAFQVNNIKEYINLCVGVGKLTNWKIGIRRTGKARQGFSRDNVSVDLTLRGGPKSEDANEYYQELRDKLLFTASGKSMNIITSGMDESLGLRKEDIDLAIKNFRQYKKEQAANNGSSEAEAETSAKNATIPSWIFREIRGENQGLLLIYLMDPQSIFYNDELKEAANKEGIDWDIPLIGYALSFPEISDDPGAVYAANQVTQIPDEPVYGEDGEIPEDFNTEINEIN